MSILNTEFVSNKLAAINENCPCMPINRELPLNRIGQGENGADVRASLEEKDTFFAGTAVFVSRSDFNKMTSAIDAIETVMASPDYIKQISGREQSVAMQCQTTTRGMFMGYDFHITKDGPKLIEINTNAGGAFLTKMLADVANISSCCMTGNKAYRETNIDKALIAMFREEWRLARGDRELKTIAIIDDAPEDQYLYPEMVQAAGFLRTHGFNAFVADTAELEYTSGKLHHNGVPIDMVYNRSTDFQLKSEAAQALKQAYENDAAIISPAPRHHALYADKRNLNLLSQIASEAGGPLSEKQRQTLAAIPQTHPVEELGDEAWSRRKKLFFKPCDGFGGKAAYRGDKMTKKVWNAIKGENFIAQEFVPPSIRGVAVNGEKVPMKYDIRIYTYAGRPLFPIARMYTGQTTNFRTKGGGFAPVVVVL